jgi:hypothetical protein
MQLQTARSEWSSTEPSARVERFVINRIARVECAVTFHQIVTERECFQPRSLQHLTTFLNV